MDNVDLVDQTVAMIHKPGLWPGAVLCHSTLYIILEAVLGVNQQKIALLVNTKLRILCKRNRNSSYMYTWAW